MPSFLDDEPTSDFLADPEDELNQFKVRPHPIGAGAQSTIREIIAQSQPKPAVSPESQTGGSPMLGSGGGEQPMAAPDELRQGLDKYRSAQAHTQNVASWQPKPEEPKWWQRLAAGAVGGAAGYVNAAGRTHVDPTAAIQGIQGVPKQQRKQAMWQSELGRAKAGEAAAGQDLTAMEHVRQVESGEKTAAGTREHLAADAGFKKQQTKTLVDEGKRQPYMRVGDGVWDTKNQNWAKEPTDKSATIPIDAAWAKENLPFLVPDAQGHYSIPTAAAQTLVRTQTTPDKPERLVSNPNEVLLNPGKYTPEQTKTAQGLFDKAHRPPLAPGAASDDPKIIAQGIMNGHQPPDTKGLYRNGSAVRAELERHGYDLMTAQRDWTAVQKHLATLNGTQQERLRQAVSFTYDSLDQIEQLYDEWRREGTVSGIKLFNRASLSVSKNLPGKAGQAATLLEAQINDLTSELGTVYKGGNGSTDESLRLAGENLKGEWNEATFKRGLDQIRKNLQIRRNSINNSQAAGVSESSPYAPKLAGSPPPAPQKPIVQHSPSTGQYRHSLDGGKTWLPGQPPK